VDGAGGTGELIKNEKVRVAYSVSAPGGRWWRHRRRMKSIRRVMHSFKSLVHDGFASKDA
jgi:hypothetical protein